MCRHTRVSLRPNEEAEDRELSNYRLETPSNELRRAQMIKQKLESSMVAKTVLFLVTILGTSMVIGDGVLTPCISVLSAVSGIKALGEETVMWVSIAILVLLFSVQRFGTDKVGYAFAPGLNGKEAWVSLGGTILCITGSEAMFADLGHFNVRAIQISFSGVVFPAILTAYCGQAAYLTKHPDQVANSSAVLADVCCCCRGCHYSQSSSNIWSICHHLSIFKLRMFSKSEGIAVMNVQVITTCMVTLIMLVIWKTNIWLVALFFLVFIAIEGLYLSAALYKFMQGGYLPLLLSLVLMIVMGIWHYVYKERYAFELKNKVSSEYVRDLVKNRDVKRVPGIMLLYSELVQGIPPIFLHFVSNIQSLHSVVVLVSIKNLPISKVVPEERFMFRQFEPREYRVFRCVVRYGYNDKIGEHKEFEGQLVSHLMEFIRHEHFVAPEQPLPHMKSASFDETLQNVSGRLSSTSIRSISAAGASWEDEVQFVQHAMEHGGVFYLLGEAAVEAKQDSWFFKKLVVNYFYSFLRKNFRQGEQVFAIPQNRLLRVGMTYEI
nr:potassium transporter 5-like [Ipomoea batatas]